MVGRYLLTRQDSASEVCACMLLDVFAVDPSSSMLRILIAAVRDCRQHDLDRRMLSSITGF